MTSRLLALAATLLALPAPAHADEPWKALAQVGTTAVSSNNVLLVPVALGVGGLVERGSLGLEAAIHIDAATLCDQPSGGDGSCGLLWIWDLAPRFTPLPSWALSPYASVRLQLTESRHHGLVPAAGPRLGVRYRGQRYGGYLEAGPSFVSAEDSRFGAFVSGRRWFPQASAGVSVALW